MISALIIWNIALTLAAGRLWYRQKNAKHICDLRESLQKDWDKIIGRQVLEALRVTQQIEREAAEAQAREKYLTEKLMLAAISSPEHMRKVVSEALELVIKQPSALQSAIEQAVAPYREDAERYRWLCESATEQQWIEYGGYTAKQHIDPTIDAARNAP